LDVTNNKIDGSVWVKNGVKTMKTKAEKALETKNDKLRSRYCLNCDQMIICKGTQGRQKFCNAACKMAYHRDLAKQRARWSPKPAARPAPDRTAQQFVNIAWANMADVETAFIDTDPCTYCGYEDKCRTIYSDPACSVVSAYVCDACYDNEVCRA
jgi:hypothetical protein